MQLNERVIRMASYLLSSRQAVRLRSLKPLFSRFKSYLDSHYKDIERMCIMSVLNSPCKDCPKRTMSCHDTCPEYIEYKKVRESISQKRLTEIANNPEFSIYKRKKRR